jgi:hypothetical protein
MVLTENGRWFAYVRSISGRATTGLGILGQAEGPGHPLRPDLRAAESYVGGLRRATTDDTDLYEAAGPGPAFSLHAGTERVDWMEGSNLRLSGPIASPGLQMLVAWRELDGTVSHMLYAHVAYEVHGEVFGEHASGYLGLAKVYMPYGLEWLVSGRRFGPATGLCALWVGFLNVYADGSTERGMMAYGGAANRFRFASVLRREGLEFATDLLEADYRLSLPVVAALFLRIDPLPRRQRPGVGLHRGS